jgi:hypothetical protein
MLPAATAITTTTTTTRELTDKNKQTFVHYEYTHYSYYATPRHTITITIQVIRFRKWTIYFWALTTTITFFYNYFIELLCHSLLGGRRRS